MHTRVPKESNKYTHTQTHTQNLKGCYGRWNGKIGLFQEELQRAGKMLFKNQDCTVNMYQK